MRFLSEAESAALVDEEMAFTAVRKALIAAVSPEATVFPAVLGHGSDPANRFTVKSGAAADLAGVKIGSFWPGNAAKGLARHNSLVLLFDQSCGRIEAVIEAGVVNAYRTAAADAVAADALARADASTLAIFGTGNQARYECVAVNRVRPLDEVYVVGRDPSRAAEFVAALTAKGLPARPASAREACEAADIIVTATSAREPLFEDSWVRAGTHVASMGSDARGKQELPPALLRRARLFCDLPSQSVTIGEMQHASDTSSLVAVGEVLAGRISFVPGAEITVFDSSGIALQDLFIAEALLLAGS